MTARNTVVLLATIVNLVLIITCPGPVKGQVTFSRETLNIDGELVRVGVFSGPANDVWLAPTNLLIDYRTIHGPDGLNRLVWGLAIQTANTQKLVLSFTARFRLDPRIQWLWLQQKRQEPNGMWLKYKGMFADWDMVPKQISNCNAWSVDIDTDRLTGELVLDLSTPEGNVALNRLVSPSGLTMKTEWIDERTGLYADWNYAISFARRSSTNIYLRGGTSLYKYNITFWDPRFGVGGAPPVLVGDPLWDTVVSYAECVDAHSVVRFENLQPRFRLLAGNTSLTGSLTDPFVFIPSGLYLDITDIPKFVQNELQVIEVGQLIDQVVVRNGITSNALPAIGTVVFLELSIDIIQRQPDGTRKILKSRNARLAPAPAEGSQVSIPFVKPEIGGTTFEINAVAHGTGGTKSFQMSSEAPVLIIAVPGRDD